jgi:hypothetical protein
VKLRQQPFSVLLPLLSIVLWVALIAVPATFIYFNLWHNPQSAAAVHLRFGEFDTVLPRWKFVIFAATSPSKADWIEAMNLPGFAINLLVPRFSYSRPGRWAPRGLMPYQWNAISFPFYCLPFWWLVGTGFDSFLGRGRLSRTALILGTLLCAFFLFCLIGLRFGISAQEREGVVYPLWGFAFWVVLFAVFPARWIYQSIASHPGERGQD